MKKLHQLLLMGSFALLPAMSSSQSTLDIRKENADFMLKQPLKFKERLLGEYIASQDTKPQGLIEKVGERLNGGGVEYVIGISHNKNNYIILFQDRVGYEYDCIKILHKKDEEHSQFMYEDYGLQGTLTNGVETLIEACKGHHILNFPEHKDTFLELYEDRIDELLRAYWNIKVEE